MDDQEAESRFVTQLTEIQLPLRLYVMSLLPGDSGVHDVAQHANTTLWRKRADFTPGTNFKAWAFSIARFEVLNHRKRQARDARLVFGEDLEVTFAEELAGLPDESEQRHEALKKCLGKLRPKDRELLLHRYSNAGTLAEYSATSGRSAGGLKVTLHRLRNALLACIRGELLDQEAGT